MSPPLLPQDITMTSETETALDLLGELVAIVRGECPSLLNEDSGGNAELSLRIDAALSRAPEVQKPDAILSKLKENGLSREGLGGLARSLPSGDAQERSPVPPLSDGCSRCGETNFSPNVEAFELSGETVCDDCADAVFEANSQFGEGA